MCEKQQSQYGQLWYVFKEYQEAQWGDVLEHDANQCKSVYMLCKCSKIYYFNCLIYYAKFGWSGLKRELAYFDKLNVWNSGPA